MPIDSNLVELATQRGLNSQDVALLTVLSVNLLTLELEPLLQVNLRATCVHVGTGDEIFRWFPILILFEQGEPAANLTCCSCLWKSP